MSTPDRLRALRRRVAALEQQRDEHEDMIYRLRDEIEEYMQNGATENATLRAQAAAPIEVTEAEAVKLLDIWYEGRHWQGGAGSSWRHNRVGRMRAVIAGYTALAARPGAAP